MDTRTQELLERLVAPGQFPNMSCSEGHELHEGVLNETERLSKAVELLGDLSGLASYAEIVGGVSVNRSAIRSACDAAYAFLAEIRREDGDGV